MWDDLRADTRRLAAGRSGALYWLEGLLFDNGYQAVLFYRSARWFKARGIPFFGPAISRLGLLLTGADISPGAEIGPGLLISHGQGLVVGGYARIGANALLLHQVTIGAPTQGRVEEMPVLGDEVFVGAGAMVLGSVTVGDGAVIGAQAIVTRDVPAGATAISTARLEIRRSDLAAPPTAPPPESRGAG